MVTKLFLDARKCIASSTGKYGDWHCFPLAALSVLWLMLCLLSPLSVFAGTESAQEDSGDPHAQHQHAHGSHFQDLEEAPPLKRSVVTYKIPQVTLVREDGKSVDFAQEMQDPKPVFLNFIYTSCTAICPVMSQIFEGLQDRLGEQLEKVHMLSISIDPEHDTPTRLDKYAHQFKAGPQWHFYTSTLQSSVAIQKAFDAYDIDKMNHTAVTFFRSAPGASWVRLDGFAMPDQLLQEFLKSNIEK